MQLLFSAINSRLVANRTNLAESDAGGGVDGSVEGYAVLAPVLDDRDVRRGGARNAEAGVDNRTHRTRWLPLLVGAYHYLL